MIVGCGGGKGEGVDDSGRPSLRPVGYGGQAESGLRVEILSIVHRYRSPESKESRP